MVSLKSIMRPPIAYSNAVRSSALSRRDSLSLYRSHRGLIIPMLLLYPNADPLGLVIEILVTFIGPYPALLLHVAESEQVSVWSSIRDENLKPCLLSTYGQDAEFRAIKSKKK